MKSYALVLGGGGAKGIYQIGVWKALRELGIKFHAVIGTSIGSINGCLIIQGNFEKAMEFWSGIELNTALNIPDEMISNGKFIINNENINKLVSLQKNIIKNRGVDTTPLVGLLNQYISEEKIRKSKTDFGLVSFNASNLQPFEIFKENIPEGELIRYIMASSALSGLKQITINGNFMLDGGLANVVPYDLARKRGYKKIIVVDVSGPGKYRIPRIAGTETIYIKNSSDLGSIIETDKNIYMKNFRMGYMDAMKTFNKYSGHVYTYKNNTALKNKINRYIKEHETQIINTIIQHNSKFSHLHELFPKRFAYDKDFAGIASECAGIVVKIPTDTLYDYEDLINRIKKSYNDLMLKKKNYEDKVITNLLLRVIRNKINLFNLSVMEYDFALSFLFSAEKIKKWIPGENLSLIIEELHGARLFFYLVDKGVI